MLFRNENSKHPNWLLSLAFLHAYEGNLDASNSRYEKAFALPVKHQNTGIQCEEFISIVLREEPAKTDLYYALGRLNYSLNRLLKNR